MLLLVFKVQQDNSKLLMLKVRYIVGLNELNLHEAVIL